MITAIEKIQEHATRIKNGEHDKIGPGKPVTMSNALVAGEGVAQGDLMLIVVDSVPKGFELRQEPSVQLVPGNTVGAKHCLDSLDGVELFYPEEWSEESLVGPVMRLSQERTVLHPTHGAVTIPGGMLVGCFYQREWDREVAAERRARD
jgi:hypothetical protein